MKKYIRVLAFILCAVMMLAIFASCSDKKNDKDKNDTSNGGGENNPELFDYENEDLSAYIELSDYKGRTLEIAKIEITDAEVESKIKSLLEENKVITKITDRAAAQGDTVVVDYTGYMNGEKFSGGSATNVTLNLVENSGYIDGFAEGVVGHTPGEEFTVPVRFPDNYGKVDYAGKDAEFVFKLHYIVEYKVTDEFADEYSKGECTSADGFDEYIKEELFKSKYDDAVYDAIWNAVSKESKVLKYPESSMEYYLSELKKQVELIARQLGTTYEGALAYLRITEATLNEYAQDYTRNDLIMYQIAKLENYIPTDADFDSFALTFVETNFAYFENDMLENGYAQSAITEESVLAYAKENYANDIRTECLRVKFSAFLVANNTFTEK